MGGYLTTSIHWDDPPSSKNKMLWKPAHFPGIVSGMLFFVVAFLQVCVSLNGGTPKTPQNDHF